MSYLEDFKKKIQGEDYQGFLSLWEEYCTSDVVDGVELQGLLKEVQRSPFAARFGNFIETALPLWERVADPEQKYEILKTILDLETTQSTSLATLAHQALEERYSAQPDFDEKMRLVGLRNKLSFRGCIRNFELLNHMAEGRFVFHTGGWGTGEILEVSPVREELAVEFEAVPGRKNVSFENAFKTLVPLPDEHFLARRFGDPDLLEEEARKDPVAIIHVLLRDLGPKSAAEIKDELCGLVIPDEDWAKWWQSARSRLKKDTQVEVPSNIRDAFKLHTEELSHVERLKRALSESTDPADLLVALYSHLRDFPEISKTEKGKELVRVALGQLQEQGSLSQAQRLEALGLYEDVFGPKDGDSFASILGGTSDLAGAINDMEIIAFKKRALVLLRQTRSDWPALFLSFLTTVQQSALRDYVLKELMGQGDLEPIKQLFTRLLARPSSHPALFLWYFQKVMRQEPDTLFHGKKGECDFFESLLVLLHELELVPDQREQVKKIYNMVTAGRYAMVREVLEGSTLEFAKEILLLASKSQSFTPHDLRILQALAEVAHPVLSEGRRETDESKAAILWMTEDGYNKLRARMEEIGTKEMIENAREIEQAREYGDLRENAEYKAAHERRARLQAELKMLSDQIHQVRILTAGDVMTDAVGVGTIVQLSDAAGKVEQYILLGPWDADPDQHILAFQSRFAQAMAGLKVGESFTYQGQTYKVERISSYFEPVAS